MDLAGRFDSTLGFPGEGPPELIDTPWFLTSVTTRDLMDAKRRRLTETARSQHPAARRLDFPTAARRQSEGGPNTNLSRTDTALGRFLKAHRERAATTSATGGPDSVGHTPVPRMTPPQAPAFACLRELQDFTNPLPLVPAGDSFEEVWKSSKNGYNKAQDAHFQRFHADFLTHGKPGKFHPMGINSGDLVGVLRRERERGASQPTIKNASASISTACAQASDGLVQLGTQDSVIRFLKGAKQSEAPDRKERMLAYPDVARLIQVAREFGPNANIGLEQLKRKLVILLMVDTAARPSDIW